MLRWDLNRRDYLAAFHPGAPGVLLSRKYSEMRPASLTGARDAIRELKL